MKWRWNRAIALGMSLSLGSISAVSLTGVSLLMPSPVQGQEIPEEEDGGDFFDDAIDFWEDEIQPIVEDILDIWETYQDVLSYLEDFDEAIDELFWDDFLSEQVEKKTISAEMAEGLRDAFRGSSGGVTINFKKLDDLVEVAVNEEMERRENNDDEKESEDTEEAGDGDYTEDGVFGGDTTLEAADHLEKNPVVKKKQLKKFFRRMAIIADSSSKLSDEAQEKTAQRIENTTGQMERSLELVGTANDDILPEIGDSLATSEGLKDQAVDHDPSGLVSEARDLSSLAQGRTSSQDVLKDLAQMGAVQAELLGGNTQTQIILAQQSYEQSQVGAQQARILRNLSEQVGLQTAISGQEFIHQQQNVATNVQTNLLLADVAESLEQQERSRQIEKTSLGQWALRNLMGMELN